MLLNSLFSTLFLLTSASALPYSYGPRKNFIWPTISDETVTFNSVSAGGTGCSNGTVSTNFNVDNTLLTVTFSEFIAYTDETPADSRKTCTLDVDVSVPMGYALSFGSAQFRGFYDLEEGVDATLSTSYSNLDTIGDQYFRLFNYGSSSTEVTTTFNGPSVNDYIVNQEFNALSWSKCGGGDSRFRFEIDMSVTTSDPNKLGLVTIDSADGSIEHKYGLVWKKC